MWQLGAEGCVDSKRACQKCYQRERPERSLLRGRDHKVPPLAAWPWTWNSGFPPRWRSPHSLPLRSPDFPSRLKLLLSLVKALQSYRPLLQGAKRSQVPRNQLHSGSGGGVEEENQQKGQKPKQASGESPKKQLQLSSPRW